ncbi:transglutaminase family protein [Hyphomicrobium sp.]|uniref:transglutaminase family protein n=1 Tax=Hyphomicrobium sp. TaxID=82 RepID=UPI000FB0C18D|nr:transglutaminase family protein [Hyphomicrobium sp.]RUO98628.1 MAG: transglutaminase family protein [Hyphomicrobium sp.]
MIFEIAHKTHYRYHSTVVQSLHLMHMTPRALSGQVVRHHNLLIEPSPASRQAGVDVFGNPNLIVDIEAPHRELLILSRSTIEKHLPPSVKLSATTPWDALDFRLLRAANERDVHVLMFRCASRLTTPTLEIADYSVRSFAPSRPVLEGAMDLIMRIYNDFEFDPHATDVSTPVSQVFAMRRGVCQDFAHLALACLRARRIPARYVSGYLHTHPPVGRPKLQGADASHAWISVWAPESGWVDLDPTNGILARDEHITVAYGRDYDDVSPISGVLRGGGEHSVSVAVDVNMVADATAN